MAEPLRLFVLAGEPSGDRIGADLVKRLRALTSVEISGVGGEELAAEGLSSMFPMAELSVMGWADVLPRLPLLLWRARQVAQAVVRTRPDVVVLIDAQEFSLAVARRVRRHDPKVPMLLYVAPAVWAWKPERAAEIKPLYDEVLSVLPFEPAVMAKLDGPLTSYVGHPALWRFKARATPPQRGPLLLLPGSREGELRRMLPLMREMASRYGHHPRVERLVIPTTKHLHDRLVGEVGAWPVPAAVVASEAEKAAAFGSAIAAIAAMGTVTLELALAGIPMVAAYIGDNSQWRRYQKYRVKWASLPNAILDRPVVPEILGLEPGLRLVGPQLDRLLGGDTAAQLSGFAQVRALMETGTAESPRADPAERVLARARRRS